MTVTLRFDDAPARPIRAADGHEMSQDLIILEGREFERVRAAKRLRIRAGYQGQSSVDLDVDLIGLNALFPRLSKKPCVQ